ncbi:MAG: sel1 repeat family protein [Burkholderiales bacterium]|nr:sel1 repeat family protein [Burkholderiales bacterium]
MSRRPLLGIVVSVLLGLASDARAVCDEEFKRVAPGQWSSDRWYRQATDARCETCETEVLRGVARAHLDKQDLPAYDAGVTACLLEAGLRSRFEEIAKVAHEGLAVRLLANRSAAADRERALALLEEAAKRWSYGSAAMRIANAHLEGKPSSASVERGVYWLERAVDYAPTTPAGSLDPGEATGRLFDIYLGGRGRPRDIDAAKALFKKVLARPRHEALLRDVMPKIPGLQEYLAQAEEAARRPIAETQRSARTCRSETSWYHTGGRTYIDTRQVCR